MEAPFSGLFQWIVGIALRLGLAVLIVLAGRKLAILGRSRLRPILLPAKLSPSMITLATTAAYYAIWLIAIMAALVALGVPLETALLIGVAVLVVLGVALQQSLRDIAATVNFILFRHFEPGDLIETNGIIGTVQEIELLNTTILQADRTLTVLPNAKIQENGLRNYSKTGTLRADMVFSVSYKDDLHHVRKVIEQVLSEDKRVLADPPPMIVVLELADSGVNIGVRPFVRAEDYWWLRWDMTEAMKLRFDQEGITIPFPQRDVHVV
jgi:small conductance mechanosensitive channel